MRIKCLGIVMAFLLVQVSGFGQGNGKSDGGYFYDTLTILDKNTHEASERLSRLRKPITRNFYLKSDEFSYSLFKGSVANMTSDEILAILNAGLSLFIDKLEHQGHKNLKPSVMEILNENDEVIEVIEDLAGQSTDALMGKMTKNAILRFSGFPISVNEKKNGPITFEVKIKE